MILLKGDKGIRFELEIAGYESPNFVTGHRNYLDANWLMIRGSIEHPYGNWCFTDPCLTTFEIERLTGWFSKLADGERDLKAQCFIEPVLEFDFWPVPALIQVRLLRESAPPWLCGRERRAEGIELVFAVAQNDPRTCACSLRESLVRYPKRGSRMMS